MKKKREVNVFPRPSTYDGIAAADRVLNRLISRIDRKRFMKEEMEGLDRWYEWTPPDKKV